MAEKMLAGQKELARMSAREKVKEGNITLAAAMALLSCWIKKYGIP